MSRSDEYQQKVDRLTFLSDKNQATLKRLAREGAQVPQTALTEMRIEMMLDTLLGKAAVSSQRLDFEIAFHEQVEHGLDNTEKKVKHDKNVKRLHVPNGARGPGRPEK